MESLTSIRRAGAQIVLTYWAAEIAGKLTSRPRPVTSPPPTRLNSGEHPMTDTESAALFERALAVTPGGVNSPVRAFRSVGGTPRFMVSGEGAEITDADGNNYVDLVGSWGPMILGHAHPAVLEAVSAAVARGLSLRHPRRGRGAAGRGDRRPRVPAVRAVPAGLVRAPRRPCRRSGWPAASPSGPRSSSSPAATTGTSTPCWRPRVPGVATFALPDSAGVTAATTAEVVVLPYNDLDGRRGAFAAHPGEIAAVITEAAAANMGVVPPEPGFNAGLAGSRTPTARC